MRLKMVFELKKPELDIEYRKVFLSLLKNGFKQASEEVFNTFYGDGTPMKPFTFGVFLNNPEFDGNLIHLKSNEITLNFSTFDSKLGIYFYNSLVQKKIRFAPYPLPNDNEMTVKRIIHLREKPVKSNEAVFKTLSPFLVRVHNKEENTDKYLTKHDESFVSQLEENIRAMVEILLGKKEHVEFMPVILNDPFPVRHYGVPVNANTGIFKLTGNPEILDFIYKVGIGSRRSEGFGLLEMV